MNERKLLMNKVQKYSFTLKELNLYLDTHPSCRRALDMFEKYRKLRDAAIKEYNEKYGPLIPEQSSDSNHWAWIDEPWPWERS